MKTLLFAPVLAPALALLLGAVAPPGRAQPPPPARHDAAPLAFLPLPGLSLVEKATYHYEAGAVDTVRTPRWERVFTLKNTSRRPITLSRLRGSCGCETLLLLKAGAPTLTARLVPGEQATVHLTVALHPGQPGMARKYVWVDGQVDGPRTPSGRAAPLATLEVDLLLRQSVSFTPASLDFGRVEAGAGARRTVAATFDPDLLTGPLTGASAPPLDGAGPDVRALPLGPMQRITEAGQPRLRQTYQVALSPSAHAGRVWGALRLGLPPPPGGGPALVAGLAVSGQVAGALDARPATVFFGSLPAGSPVTRSVVLSVVLPPAPPGGQTLTVTTSSPWLVASLDRPAVPGPHRLLSVTLTGLAPAGPVQGKVTVALSGGERLDIPVIAELTH